jgi:hypothetical protein
MGKSQRNRKKLQNGLMGKMLSDKVMMVEKMHQICRECWRRVKIE